MKRYLFLSAVIISLLMVYVVSSGEKNGGAPALKAKKGLLLLPENNLAIIVLDLEEAGLSFLNPEDIAKLREFQEDLNVLPGSAKIDSLLNASRVVSQGDDIIVSKAVPEEKERLTRAYLKKLSLEISEFPELRPYINQDRDILLFYVYYSAGASPGLIYEDLQSLQEQWAGVLPFEFTGKSPVIAETESLLTKDIILFFPLLGLMVLVVFAFFRSLKVIGVSLFLMIFSMTAAYVCIRFLGIPDSPLILLIPVFSMGLLSDYLIHYFYHRIHFSPEGETGTLRKRLLFPLTLTALSTLLGFLSLSLINGSGHRQLGIIISLSVVITWTGVFFWVDYGRYPSRSKPLLANFQEILGRIFVCLARVRGFFFLLILGGMVWGGLQLRNFSIEPYPIQQLPSRTTIKKADSIINKEFYGTIPFFIEVDTGEKQGILKKESLQVMDEIHTKMDRNNLDFTYSLLTVLKRMNYYFMGSEETLLASTEFDDFYEALIEQYLLYYSSSVDPLEYESLLDNSYRFVSIRGLFHYENSKDLDHFTALVKDMKKEIPSGWSLSVHGMARQLEIEQSHLKNNWIISFLGGGFLIFITVLIFYKQLSLALLSLIPGGISMLISLGIISMAGISIDVFSIIFAAIITGLVIDYSIHTLAALNQLPVVGSLKNGFQKITGYSGVPIFLSFLTSALSFSVLFLSSFRGARSLGFLLLASLILSFFLSLYLIPLIILPIRLKKEHKNV